MVYKPHSNLSNLIAVYRAPLDIAQGKQSANCQHVTSSKK